MSVAEPVVDYLQRLIQFTRTSEVFEYGLSPRAALAILQSAKAISLLDGRTFVIPEDIQAVFPGRRRSQVARRRPWPRQRQPGAHRQGARLRRRHLSVAPVRS